ncbi:MAG: class I SAM-dependent methyltransferase [Candidatus Levybacteria bacterium]|nr:class I SAM-dependent methyltransferase [Candidatus Levybacteria bacterium]
MFDQKKLWDKAHQDGEINHYSSTPTELAEEVIKIIQPSSKILELGCGVGNDSGAFTSAGHHVLATDFSEVAIRKNSERFKDDSNLTFEMLDMSQPFRFADNEFDVVYARLSLHYFTEEITRRVFSEIHRVLKPNGYFCFMCKSTKDPLYGKGKEIEKDMFEYEGHVRHFFNEESARSMLDNNFKIDEIECGDGKFYGSDSAYVKAIATAVK